MILFILSFVAGVLTVLAPCTLPLLPVIVGSSVSGIPSKKKVFIITGSLAFSIILFTLLLKVSSLFISVPPEFWAIVSGIIIILFGLISLFPRIWDSLPLISKINQSGNKLLALGYQKENVFGNIIIGLSLGPVFSSCSPTYFVILATVLPQSLALGLIDLLAYALGLSLMLLLVAFVGQKVMSRIGVASDTEGWFRKSLGVIFIIIGIMIIFGFDKVVEARLLSGGLFDITRIEQKLLEFNSPSSTLSEGKEVPESEATREESKGILFQKTHGPKAPEIVNPSGFINTGGEPITIGQFKGKKVVLLDIWTYSCINCQRTLPYVEGWYEKYKDMGLVVIGLHTPEFAFEKVKSNVEDGVKKYGLTYPVVMDNDYSTWTAYGNQYWPRKYLISGDGEIVYDHIGEGNYAETEEAIKQALSELNGSKVEGDTTVPKNAISFDPSRVKSPETYFGASRNEYLANGRQGVLGEQSLSIPSSINSNALYLSGTWDFSAEYASSKTASKIIFKYNSKNVYMVASSDSGITIKILKDGIMEKSIFIKGNQLYTLIEGSDYGEHTLEVDAPADLNAFTFTFG
jgi:cytochrome c biogenesis protein CcdA/thiol-disulfide isomerase/thioredoxin